MRPTVVVTSLCRISPSTSRNIRNYSTVGSLTVAIADMTVPSKKYELIGETEKEIVRIDKQYRRGPQSPGPGGWPRYRSCGPPWW